VSELAEDDGKDGVTKKTKHSISFVVMTVLIFVGLNLFLGDYYSSGPNSDWTIGGIHLHRHGQVWTIQSFSPFGLIITLLLSILITWTASKILRHRIQ
jgi:hypothetical protein